jgi:hypothetical protein
MPGDGGVCAVVVEVLFGVVGFIGGAVGPAGGGLLADTLVGGAGVAAGAGFIIGLIAVFEEGAGVVVEAVLEFVVVDGLFVVPAAGLVEVDAGVPDAGLVVFADFDFLLVEVVLLDEVDVPLVVGVLWPSRADGKRVPMNSEPKTIEANSFLTFTCILSPWGHGQ